MKLKQIPQTTVVHTPTEEEAKELLAFLHENGYKWCGDTSLLDDMENKIAYKIMGNKRVTHQTPKYFMDKGFHILTLADFKRKYCEEEKPQLRAGDRVKVVGYQTDCIATMATHVGEVGTITRALEENENYYKITCDNGRYSWHKDWLEPYTEPETKEKESGEKGNNPENSQLDLCELLKGHEGETFFLPAYWRMCTQ